MTLIKQLDKLYYNEPKGEYGASIGFVGADGTKEYCNNAEAALGFLKENAIYERKTVKKKDGGTFEKMQVLKRVDLEVDNKSVAFAVGPTGTPSAPVYPSPKVSFSVIAATFAKCLRESKALFEENQIADDIEAIQAGAATMFIACGRENVWVGFDGMDQVPAAIADAEADADASLPF